MIPFIKYQPQINSIRLSKKLSFSLPSNLIKNNIETIYIIYYNNCYHIGYARNAFNKSNNILKKLKKI